jgi:phosphoglycerate dehydrogenase-like enzyme
MPYKTLFITERGLRHQQDALHGAPPELDVVMLRQPAGDALVQELQEAEFLISERVGEINAAMIRAAPQLRLIVRLGSMAHDIDLEAARAAGVAVCLWPQRGVIMVAEHIVMQMLALAKKLREVESVALAAEEWGQSRRTDEDTFAYNWSDRAGIDGLHGQSVGILGFGEIGAALARRLAGWGCTMRYHRRRRLPAAAEEELGILYAERDALLAESDFVANLLPYFAETEHSLDAEAFALMKPGAFLVSCGSGSVIDEATLADALRSGRLAGAALDTYEWEPIRPDNSLRQLALENEQANILLTPHTAAGAAPAGASPSRRTDYEPIARFLRGDPLPNRLA